VPLALLVCRLFRFLGYVDKLGVAFEAPSIATGYGGYIAQVGALSLASLLQTFCRETVTKNILIGSCTVWVGKIPTLH
jgi:hypothetical protein